MTLYTPKEAYASLTDEQLKLFTKPDYTHIHPNIKVEGPFRIPFDEIFIDDVEGNVARYDSGIDPAHIQALKNSFANGVVLTEECPAVSITDGYLEKTFKSSKLRYGFGRSAALLELGLDGWFFFKLTLNGKELSETLWERVCLSENEPLPKGCNKELNIINVFIGQVKRGVIKNTEKEIFKALKETFPHRPKPSLNRIVQGVYKAAGTKLRYTYYTESKIKQWVKNYASEPYVFSGKLDQKRKMHGYTAKQGSLIRTYEQAIKNKAETGLDSYVVMHVGEVTQDSPIEKKRNACVKEYVTIREAHAQVYGNDVNCLHVLGCLPQQVGKEKWDRLCPLEIPQSGYGNGNPLINKALGIVEDF